MTINIGNFVGRFLNLIPLPNRVIPNVRKTQHQNPEFGHTQDEILKNFHYHSRGDETQKTINFGA
jgi:hypothetical protein